MHVLIPRNAAVFLIGISVIRALCRLLQLRLPLVSLHSWRFHSFATPLSLYQYVFGDNSKQSYGHAMPLLQQLMLKKFAAIAKKINRIVKIVER